MSPVRQIRLSIEEILERIEELGAYDTKCFISSLDLTLKQMAFLDDHENKNVRRGLARNPNLTKKLMIKFSSEENRGVKLELVYNPNLTEKVMLQLASDRDMGVRARLAKNLNITEKVMIKLINDKDWHVRFGLGENLTRHLPKNIMIQLASDENNWVREQVSGRFQHLYSLKKEELEKAYDLIMKSKNIGRKNFEKTFDFIINRFPELSEFAKMFKRIILKGKKDLK